MEKEKDVSLQLARFAAAFEALRKDERVQLVGLPVTVGMEIRIVDEAAWLETPGKNITVEEVQNFGEAGLKPYRIYKEITPGVRIYMNATHYSRHKLEIKEAA